MRSFALAQDAASILPDPPAKGATMPQKIMLKACAMLLLAGTSAIAAAANQETIVLVRHGEKPAGGYGQLDCQGLNRALALPSVLGSLYGTPSAIYAPDPHADQVSDPAGDFDYVRPLATIEPTAIRYGLPVHTPDGYTQIDKLQKHLLDKKLEGATVFVAWEHKELVKLAKNLIGAAGGDSSVVPKWSDDDFDSIYVVTLRHDGGATTASFQHGHENLNNQSQTCPP
jgi:hypothetical protein